MMHIDLSLKKHDEYDSKVFTLAQAIENDRVVILLGSPGSGKTSILKKYRDEHANIQFLKVKKFLLLPNQVEEETEVLLLDGLDEYRSIMDDKSFVITQLGYEINKLRDIKVVISCREMDWYGETDRSALKDEIDVNAILYSILSLDDTQKVKLAYISDIKSPQEFIHRFSDYGFLENPQMFSMLAQIYKANPEDLIGSKKDLYLTFIKNAREQNSEYKRTPMHSLEVNEMLKVTGYIASYYMLAGVDEINDDFIDEVSNAEKGYGKELLETVRHTKLFSENKFIHRTIAEFSLANFLKEKMDDGNFVSMERIRNILINNGRVPTELRGTYAWLCSLSEREELIKVDPYYQAIHGDNSLLNNALKKKIVLEVKEYAKTNPYFFTFSYNMDLKGFYNVELDTLLIDEFNDSIGKKNHYIYFLIDIMVSTEEISPTMRDFLKEKIFDHTTPSYLKDDMIKAFITDIDFLMQVLTAIQTTNIMDENDNIKEALLNILYPNYINSEQIADYLVLYNDKVGGHCYFLYDTNYEEKFHLIDKIYQASFEKDRDPALVLPDNTKGFIEDYFLETLLKYKNGLTAQDIYNIIKHFKQYKKWYETIRYQSYRYTITDEIAGREYDFIELANELFSLYLDDVVKSKNDKDRIYNFKYFFNYKSPSNQSEILFGKMDLGLSPDVNQSLFDAALAYAPKDEHRKLIVTTQIEDLAEKYELQQVSSAWQNPEKSEWEIESEKRALEEEEKDKKIRDENEKYFSSKSSEEIGTTFGDLNFIASLLFIDRDEDKINNLEKKTFERLKTILKEAVTHESISPEHTNLSSLAIESPNARRNIDTVYYVSMALNDKFEININDEFSKYLYMNVLAHDRSSNIIKTNFLNEFEEKNKDSTIVVLKEYLSLLLKEHFSCNYALLVKYIDAENDVFNLKILAKSYESNLGSIQDSFFNNFLDVFNFHITPEDLNELIASTIDSIDEENKNTMMALKTFAEDKKDDFNINMAIALHSLFQYNIERFNQSNSKIKIIDYMITQFDTEDSIKNVSGLQSPKSQTASFLRNDMLKLLDLEELIYLHRLHLDDIWTYRIANKINELEQLKSDQSHTVYSIEKIKNFMLSETILSIKDFFTDIYLKLNDLKQEIEDNRNNDKDPFYNQNRSKKTEEACRDVILHRLNDKYGYSLELSKEKYEANNRVDINIKYKANDDYEVQVECKRDDNQELNTGIPDQLIGKYFSSAIQYGIYLVFYFGDKKGKALMLEKINNSIPASSVDNVKVICIDLTYE